MPSFEGASDCSVTPSKLESQGEPSENLCEYCQNINFREGDHVDISQGCDFNSEETSRRKRLVYVSKSSKAEIVKFDIDHIRTDILPGLPSITATAEAGCAFCEILLFSNFMKKCAKVPEASKVAFKFSYEWNRASSRLLGFSVAISVHCRNGEIRDLEDPAFCCLEAERDDPCADWLGIRSRPQFRCPSLDERFQTMGKWVTECVETCHPQPNNGNVPTRLLDIGTSDAESGDIRLIQSDGEASTPEWRYAALSHCWGYEGQPPLRTTADSLAGWLDNIPFDMMPRNYQDAVRVTRGLGIRYLWIDSLCIIQDDIHDWDKESIKMNELYQQAYVTLVAANGSSCHDGFLNFRPPRRVKLSYGPSSVDPTVKGTYYLREVRGLGARDIEQSAWRTRGWTFQESLFSMRKLFFTASTVYYHCGYKLQSTGWQQRRYRHGEHFLENLKRVSEKSTNRNDFYHGTWYGRVQEYSGRNLTIPQDRLPAVAAWASELAKTRPSRYLAGLWEEGLCYWLLWCASKLSVNRSLAHRLRFATSPEFVAPSWSWASQTYKVHWHWPVGFGGKRIRTAAQVVESKVIPKSRNTFGRLVSGYLRIKGAVCAPPDQPLHRTINGAFSFIENQYGLRMSLDWMEPCVDVESGQEIPYGIVKNLLMLKLVETGTGLQVGGLMLLPSGKLDEYWRVGIFIIDKDKEPRTEEIFDPDCEERLVKIV